MGLVKHAAVTAMAMVLCAAGPVGAAQSGFDIDLRELRPAPADKRPQQPPPASLELDLKELRSTPPPPAHTPTPHKRRVRAETAPEASEAADAGVGPQESIHVVRPGEHLFLILMKSYGLSNQAAERLIPEVMRLNHIPSPTGLRVGQRLRIPLPAKGASRPASTAPAVTVAPTPPTPAPAAPPIAASAPPPKPAPRAAGGTGIVLTAAPPCELARAMVEKLGLLAPPTTRRLQGLHTVSAAHAGRNVTVVCGLSLAELYTFERLAAHDELEILAFEGGESEERVVEKLANKLGLVFRKRDPGAAALPLTYIFAPFGGRTTELPLTIQPAPAAPAR